VPRISGLEPDPRRPGAVRVLVDGRWLCTVDSAGAAAACLGVGDEWTGDRQASAGRAADEEGAWRAVLKALERRNHAVGELRRRMVLRGHPPEAVDHAIARALATGLLDDAAFARHYVFTRTARGCGPARLRRDLAARGVSQADIEAALAAHRTEPEEEVALIGDLARKRARRLAGLPRDVQRRRLLAYLGRRGFSGVRVADLVSRLLREA
jgi:regulatory protein